MLLAELKVPGEGGSGDTASSPSLSFSQDLEEGWMAKAGRIQELSLKTGHGCIQDHGTVL